MGDGLSSTTSVSVCVLCTYPQKVMGARENSPAWGKTSTLEFIRNVVLCEYSEQSSSARLGEYRCTPSGRGMLGACFFYRTKQAYRSNCGILCKN